MSKIMDKMMNMMKIYDEDEYEEYEQEEVVENIEPEVKPIKNYKRSNSKVVNIHTNAQMEVIVLHPENYDEAQDICDHIKGKKPVIINLEKIDFEISQRIMDFASGACYALGGNLQRVTNNIFIIAPDNVEIGGELKNELKSNGIILPWKND